MAGKKSTPAASTAEITPTAEVTDVAAATNETITENYDVTLRVTAALLKAQAIQAAVKELTAMFKGLQRDVTRLQKASNRKTRSRGANAGANAGTAARRPSGFAKPTALSKELCDFLGLPEDSKLARTEVTRMLNLYVKNNNLQDPEDKRTIRPDAALQKVLNLQDEKLTYFNLQSHIKHHFVKGPEAAVTA